MEWGIKFHPRNVAILSLLGRDDMGQEGSPGEEPPTTEYVEDVEHREFDDLGKCPGGLVPTLRFSGRGKSHEDVPWGGGKRRRDIIQREGRKMSWGEHGGKRSSG
jgi:hypothetical protein